MGDVLCAFDRFQRRHPTLGLPLAVIYKFFDDQGNYLAATLTYYAFIAIFPLLLIASSVLGFLLEGDPSLQHQILNSALSQFPIIGDQLGRPGGVQGSPSAVIVGTLTALYGATGVAHASQNLMNIVWSVPRNSRPNPILVRLKSVLLVVAAGSAVTAVAVLNSLGAGASMFGGELSGLVRALGMLLTTVVYALVFMVLFRVATAHKHSMREAAPGAIAVAVMWQGLQVAGAVYVQHVIVRANDMNQTFALVLGLVALIYIAAVMAVLGTEINVVRVRGFYPRALLTPFTDHVELTEGDRRAYTAYATGQRHKGFQSVRVTFHTPPDGSEGADSPQTAVGPDSRQEPGAPDSRQAAGGAPDSRQDPDDGRTVPDRRQAASNDTRSNGGDTHRGRPDDGRPVSWSGST